MQETLCRRLLSAVVLSCQSMVGSGHDAPVRQLEYAPASVEVGAIELLSFADLRRIDRRGRRAEPQRPQFNVLAIVRHGRGRCRIDFSDGALAPRCVVWVRPGQVHQWLDVDAIQGDLVLFTPTAVGYDPGSPVQWPLEGRTWELTVLAVDHLRAELDAAPDDPIAGDLLTALLRRCVAGSAGGSSAGNELARSFSAAVEAHLAGGRRSDVRRLAAELNYAPRTVNRAVVAATGISAKAWVDQRTVLEAQRLLAHSNLSAAACARQLGFEDAANFSAFFKRCTGTTPGRWRLGATGR